MPRTDTEQLVVALEAKIRDFERNFAKANRTASQNWSQIERRGQQAASRITGSFKAIGAGLVAGLAVTALASATRAALDHADALAKASRQIGVTVEQLQGLRHGAELAGVGTRALDTNLERFAKRLGEADAGTGALRSTLERYGIQLRDSEGRFRSVNDLLFEFADLIQKAESPQERLAIATAAFGREGAKMVELLKDGAAGLKAYLAESERLGQISQEQAEAAERANDAMTRLSTAFGVARDQIVLGVAPNLEALAKILTDHAIPAFKEAKQAVTDFFASFGEVNASNVDLRIGTINEQIAELARKRDELTREAQAQGLEAGDVFAVQQANQELQALFDRRAELVRQRDAFKEMADAARDAAQATGSAAGITPQGPLQVDIRDDSTPGPNTDPLGGRVRPGPSRADVLVPETFTSSIGDPEAERRLAQLQATRAEQEKLTQSTVQYNAAAIAAANTGNQFALTVASGLTQAVFGATSFADAFKNITQQIAEAIVQALIFRAIMAVVGGPATAAGPGTGLIGLFAGGFASGGTIPAHKLALVGERGPELIASGPTPLNVTPMPAMGGAQTINYQPEININVEGGSRGPEADRELAGRIGDEVDRAVRATVTSELRNQMRSGNMLNPARQTL